MRKLNLRRFKIYKHRHKHKNSQFFLHYGKCTYDWKLRQFLCFYERRGNDFKNVYVLITF